MDINLSEPIRNVLHETQRTANLTARTQKRIATGLKFNSLVDNAQAVSVSTSLSNRASDLIGVKNNISQGASALGATLGGLDTVSSTLKQIKAVAQQYQSSGSATEKAALSDQFDVLKTQLDQFVNDTSYGGTALIGSSPDTLNVPLNEDGSASLTVTGQASDSASLGITLDPATVDAALSQVRSTAETIGSNASVLQIRENFTSDLVNGLEQGAAKLVQTDLNEEAANALSLQTRTQLGAAALRIAANSERAVLQLF